MYRKLSYWDYEHRKVEHGKKENARDEDLDGFYEVQWNTIEGI